MKADLLDTIMVCLGEEVPLQEGTLVKIFSRVKERFFFPPLKYRSILEE